MFLANIFGVSKPYTTRGNATRALAFFIQKNQMQNVERSYNNSLHTAEDLKKGEIIKSFKTSMAQENYGQALQAWNEYAREFLWHNSFFITSIVEVEVDKPFS